MPRIHLIVSADPVPNGCDQVAICGDNIPNASAVPLTEMDTPASTLLFCKECFKVLLNPLGQNYFYALATGQDARDLEVEP